MVIIGSIVNEGYDSLLGEGLGGERVICSLYALISNIFLKK